MTPTPARRAPCAIASTRSGERWAEATFISTSMPNSFKVSWAGRSCSRSESDPITIKTFNAISRSPRSLSQRSFTDVPAKLLPRKFDVGHRLVGAALRYGQRVGGGGDDEDAPAGGAHRPTFAARAGVEHHDAGHAARFVEPIDRVA